jgi:hypothetical protein
MQSMIPMLSSFPAMTFSIAPHFAWLILAVLLLAGLSIVASALRAERPQRVGAGSTRTRPGKPAGRILPPVERPAAA